MRLVGFVLGDHEPISFVDTAGDTVYAQVVKLASRELGQSYPIDGLDAPPQPRRHDRFCNRRRGGSMLQSLARLRIRPARPSWLRLASASRAFLTAPLCGDETP